MATILDSIDRKLKRKRRTKKQGVIDGFYAYLVGGRESSLLGPVYALAQAALSRVDEEFTDEGALNLGDDFAQEIAIKVWEDFQTFEGDGGEFYARVSRIISNHRHDARDKRFRESNTEVHEERCTKKMCEDCYWCESCKEQGWRDKECTLCVWCYDYRKGADEGVPSTSWAPTNVPLMVDSVDEDGEEETITNPELTQHPTGYIFKSNPIPESVQGMDRDICEEILFNGKTYVEIADMFGMTENAIEHRVRKLRDRLEYARAQERASKEKQRSERDREYNNQVMSRQRSRVRMATYLSSSSLEGR